jgi:hypothetical protein
MRVECNKKGNIVVVEIHGNMYEPADSMKLATAFDRLIEEGERTFVFDLTGVPKTLTEGINTVVACRNRAVRREGIIKLAIRGKVKEIYLALFLDNLFEMYDDVQAALASFAA